MEVLIGVAAVVLAGIGVIAVRRARRDETFEGITPGLLPAPGQDVQRIRVGAGQGPPIAVRFDPPAGVGPALAGLIAESRIAPVAISATLVDLAGRGWLTLRPIEEASDTSRRSSSDSRDWVLQRLEQPPAEQLSRAERVVLDAAFANGPVTTLFEFRSSGAGLEEGFLALDAEARERNWFQPAASVSTTAVGAGVAVLGLFLLFFGQSLFPVGLGLLAAGLLVVFGTRRRAQPVTAEGYAARVQALGFKRYLATAEAERLQFEAGIDRFSRYLPYAMVFGLVDHWRHVFAAALQSELDAGHEFTGLAWLATADALNTVVLIDLLTADGGLLDNLVHDFGGGEFWGDWSESGGAGGFFVNDGGGGDWDGGDWGGGFGGGDFGGGGE